MSAFSQGLYFGSSVVSPTMTYQWTAATGALVTNTSLVSPPSNDQQLTSWTDTKQGLVLWTNGGSGTKWQGNIQNGKGGITFGTATSLTNGSIPVTLASASGTIFIAFKTASSGSTVGYFDSANNANRWFIYKLGGDNMMKAGTGATTLDSLSALTTPTPYIYAVKFAGASSSVWSNNVSVATGNTGTGTTLSSIMLGNLSSSFANGAQGNILEVRVYNSALSDAQIQTVFGELNSTWAIY